MNEVIKSIDKILHLNECEQEGILSGMPTPKQWEIGL